MSQPKRYRSPRRGGPVPANAGGHCRCGCRQSIAKGDLIVIRENKWYLAACMALKDGPA